MGNLQLLIIPAPGALWQWLLSLVQALCPQYDCGC